MCTTEGGEPQDIDDANVRDERAMSYLPAFHLTDGPFVRCRDCAAIVYQTDTATHDAWHEDIESRIAKAAKTAGRAVFPNEAATLSVGSVVWNPARVSQRLVPTIAVNDVNAPNADVPLHSGVLFGRLSRSLSARDGEGRDGYPAPLRAGTMSEVPLRRRIPPKTINELAAELMNNPDISAYDAQALATELHNTMMEEIYRLARIGETFERLKHCPPSPLERETRPALYWNGYADGWNGAQQWVRDNVATE